jgi:hypothetical protein
MDPNLKNAIWQYLTTQEKANPDFAQRLVTNIEANPTSTANRYYIEAGQRLIDRQNMQYVAQQEVNRMGDMNKRGLEKQYGMAAYDQNYLNRAFDQRATPDERARNVRDNARYRQEQMAPTFQAPARAMMQLSQLMDPMSATDIVSKLFPMIRQMPLEPTEKPLKPSAITRHGHAGD